MVKAGRKLGLKLTLKEAHLMLRALEIWGDSEDWKRREPRIVPRALMLGYTRGEIKELHEKLCGLLEEARSEGVC